MKKLLKTKIKLPDVDEYDFPHKFYKCWWSDIISDSSWQSLSAIKKSKTADRPMPSSQEKVTQMPEVNNLINIFTGVTSFSKLDLITKYEGQNFSNFKNDLSDALVEKIAPIGDEINKLMKDKSYLDQIMREGTEKARNKSELVLKEVYDIVGFIKA